MNERIAKVEGKSGLMASIELWASLDDDRLHDYMNKTNYVGKNQQNSILIV